MTVFLLTQFSKEIERKKKNYLLKKILKTEKKILKFMAYMTPRIMILNYKCGPTLNLKKLKK